MNETVKVVQLLDENRQVAGSLGLVQDPVVGDVGKVIYEYPPPDSRVTVEKTDESGNTVWFADFEKNELEFLDDTD